MFHRQLSYDIVGALKKNLELLLCASVLNQRGKYQKGQSIGEVGRTSEQAEKPKGRSTGTEKVLLISSFTVRGSA